MLRIPGGANIAAVATLLTLFGSVRAAERVAELTARDIQRASAYCESGTKSLGLGDVAKAQDFFRKALEIVPEYPDGHLGMGHILMKQNHFAEALAEYERGRDGFATLGDATFDIRVQHYTAAQRQITAYRDALRQIQGDSSTVRMSGSEAVGNSGRADPAKNQRDATNIEEAIRKLEAIEMPTRESASEPPGEVWFHIGNAQFRLGRLDDAVRSWESCAQRSPKFGLVRNNLAVAYWKQGRFEDAKRSLQHAAELGFPTNPQMRADLDKAAAEAAARPAPPQGSPAEQSASPAANPH